MRTPIVAGFCVFPMLLQGQALLLDRSLSHPETASGAHLGIKKSSGFLADVFDIGTKGDVWVIDRIRMWGRFDSGHMEPVALFGGLEATAPAPGAVDCDCHNLIALQRGATVSRLAQRVWQLDFGHLNWSVPGGVPIQFGVSGAGWSAYTANSSADHTIKMFDPNGKLTGPYAANPGATLAVQVWGHLPATIEIQRDGDLWKVILHGNAAFDARLSNRGSLRFGSKGAIPTSQHVDGADLVMTFRTADAGIQPNEVNACLNGRRQDGVPFEGCDLLKRPPH